MLELGPDWLLHFNLAAALMAIRASAETAAFGKTAQLPKWQNWGREPPFDPVRI
jgi:hypothetical protein